MSAVETVKDFMIALEAKEFDKAASYLSDDFIFSGWTPQPGTSNAFTPLTARQHKTITPAT